MKKAFDRVLIVMFENQYRSYVMQNPYMRKLASAGANLTNFFGAFHPSQTNYLASLAGEVCGVTGDTPPASPLKQKTLVDVLEPAGVSWKAYMEGYPGDPWKTSWQSADYPPEDQPLTEYPDTPQLLARYFRKHNAFASFHTIQKNQARWNRIVSDTQFWTDVGQNDLPEYSWFTPDIWNDGHYLHNTHIDTDPRTQLVPQMSTWLEYVFLSDPEVSKVQGVSASGENKLGLGIDVDLLLTNPTEAWAKSRIPKGTLVVITFDEADYDANEYDTNYDGPNQIYTVLLGDMIEPGTVIDTPFNHYSLMKTIERNFGTDTLEKNDRDANWFRFMWNESFSWSQPTETLLRSTGNIALAPTESGATLFFQDSNGALLSSEFNGNEFESPQTTTFEASDDFASASLSGEVHLVFANVDGHLFAASRQPSATWSEAEPINQQTFGSITLTSYVDDADSNEKLMLCWQAANGFIQYSIYADGSWNSKTGNVGQLTDGPMALAQMGPSLFLVYKERNSRRMKMTSYNLAPFNAFDALNFEGQPAPQNDTSLHEWSPGDWNVGNFAKKMAALQNDYQAHGRLAMASIEGEMHLIHRGAYADMPNGYTERFGLTGIFTASNQMTNGFGTLDQAGWTIEEEVPWMQLDPSGGIALTSNGQQFLLVWQPAAKSGTNLRFCTGRYCDNQDESND